MKTLPLLLILFLGYSSAYGQSNSEILQSIKQESKDSSQVMRSISYLSDVFGPRLMGTSNYYESVLWAKSELERWGISRTKLHSFDKDNIGWEATSFNIDMTEPSLSPISAFPLAFTRSTNGAQEAEVIAISSFNEAYEMKDDLKGKIVLLKGYYRPVKNIERPFSTRLSDEILTRAKANPDPNDLIIGYHSRRSTADVFDLRARTKEERATFFEFCEEQGVVSIIEPSDYPYGILHADGNRLASSFNKKNDLRPLPSFVIANEHFGRLIRLIDLGYTPKLKVQLDATYHENPEYNVNLIADIEGSDPKLKSELVIVGAHLDSWHAGTGAVDNASNAGVIMEAMRLLQKSGIKPKRTIRMILWGGEEQVFAGSAEYINDYVGDLVTTDPKDEKNKISAYLNLDNGAGMIRGLYLMGNNEVTPYFSEYLQPFDKSQTLTLQNANQTDHELFDYQNIPAFQFIQDPLDYISAVHHTNMDVYEYVPEKDQIYNAELIAYFAYRIAQEDVKLPRKKFNTPIPSKKGNVVFEFDGHQNAKRVYLVGDFNNWNMFGTPLYKTEQGWETKIDLPKGRYYYKYIIDGYWTADPATAESDLVKDGKGHGGLTVRIVN